MASYTKLASFMTEKHHPILKKYQHLAVRDLLYLQAELCNLDHEYESVAKKDASEKDERNCYDRDWFLLESSKRRDFGGQQWAVAAEIREKLREYYSAISQYSEIAALPQPKSKERNMLQRWIDISALAGPGGFLGRDLAGFEQPSLYEDQNDLAILSDIHGEDDLFTNFVMGPLLTVFHWAWKRTRTPLPIDPENPAVGENKSTLHHYDNRRVDAVTNVLGTVLSSLAPLVSIVALSFVNSPKIRLGLVCGFTIGFCLCLAVATKARRIEIFAATAAFASVQVVFVGISNNNVSN